MFPTWNWPENAQRHNLWLIFNKPNLCMWHNKRELYFMRQSCQKLCMTCSFCGPFMSCQGFLECLTCWLPTVPEVLLAGSLSFYHIIKRKLFLAVSSHFYSKSHINRTTASSPVKDAKTASHLLPPNAEFYRFWAIKNGCNSCHINYLIYLSIYIGGALSWVYSLTFHQSCVQQQ